MRKILFILIVAALALFLCGCASQSQAPTAAPQAPPTTPQLPPTTPQAAPNTSGAPPMPNQTPPAPPTVPPAAVEPPASVVQAHNVEIKNFAFSPTVLTIKKGDSVAWINSDSAPHTVTSDSGNEIGSGTLPTGGTYSHTFNAAGTFEYHCSIHTSMKAKIIVQ